MSSNQTLNSGDPEVRKEKESWDHDENENGTPSPGLNDEKLDREPSLPEGDETGERPQLIKRKTKRLVGKLHPDGRRELTEEECYDKLGYSYPWYKKWTIITIVFLVQLQMNFNTSVYPSVMEPLTEHFMIGMPVARVGQMLFLVAYAFGCELWAPWSEELGRWPIMQLSLFFVNVWQLPCALAPNIGSVLIGRFLGGLSLAGGSVTLGMCADMWEPNDQGYAVAYIVLSSVGGTSIGPIFGGIIKAKLAWFWNFWIQLIFGGVVQIIHFFFASETRASILVDREAKRRRDSGEDDNIWGPSTFHRIDFKEVIAVLMRPFIMFVKEPIVLFLSLLSGFSDMLIFICLESFPLVFEQWHFSTIEEGLVFCAIVIGYFVAYFVHVLDVARQQKILKTQGEAARYAERRLLLLLFLAPLETIGLFGFAWTSQGPSYNHWMGPVFFVFLIAMANYSIYMSTIDYMVAAYGPYSASATGGNGFARDFLAGISAMFAAPMYQNFGPTKPLQWASTFLGFVAIIVAIPIYVFYWKGPVIRKKSKFAQTLAADRELRKQRSISIASQQEESSGEEEEIVLQA